MGITKSHFFARETDTRFLDPKYRVMFPDERSATLLRDRADGLLFLSHLTLPDEDKQQLAFISPQ